MTNEERLRSTTDAAVWAEEFCRVMRAYVVPVIDEGLMISWFANAIEMGRQAGHEQGYAAGMTAAAEALT